MSVSTVYDDVVVGTFQADSDHEGSGDKPSADAAEAEKTSANGPAKRQLGDLAEEGGGAKHARTADDSDVDILGKLRRQIEYYFSDANLSQDDFFHTKISADPEGWLDASWLLGCPRVVDMGVTDDGVLERALQSSHLETRWRPSAPEGGGAADCQHAAPGDAERAAAGQRALQVRRPPGQELPALLKAGWLQEKIAARRLAAAAEQEGREEEAGVAAGAPCSAPRCSELAVGMRVRIRQGDSEGQAGQVLAIEEGEVTLALEAGDVATVAVEALEKR